MINQIVVPLDGSTLSEQVLPLSVALAKKLGSTVTLLNVLDTRGLVVVDGVTAGLYFDPLIMQTQMGADMVERRGSIAVKGPEHKTSLEQLIVAEKVKSESYLRKVAEGLVGEGIKVDVHVVVGTPAEAIVSYAEAEGADLIAMGTHGRTGLARWMMGSVTDRVLHLTDKPLLLYRPRTDGEVPEVNLRTVILPVDGSSLAEQAFPLAEHLAQRLGLTIEPTYVIANMAFAFADPMPYGGGEFSMEVIEGLEQEANAYLDKTTKRLREKGLLVELRLLRGDPGMELVNLIRKTPGGLTVMTTHGRSGLGRFVLGSVTDKVVSRSGGPVLVVRAGDE